LFKNSLGRIRLFETGTVEIFVRKPASLGKCKQLFSDAFTRLYLIENIRVVDNFFKELVTRSHMTYKVGMRVPYMKVTTFQDTHKMIFVAGDRTHPDCYEFVLEYHAEVENARALMEQFRQFVGDFRNGEGGPKPLGKMDYST
jgi:hypothetical protein